FASVDNPLVWSRTARNEHLTLKLQRYSLRRVEQMTGPAEHQRMIERQVGLSVIGHFLGIQLSLAQNILGFGRQRVAESVYKISPVPFSLRGDDDSRLILQDGNILY